MAAASMKDWLSGSRLLPSWVLSGLFHAALVALLLWLMPLYQPRMPVGDTDEPGHEIGIVIKERGELVEPREATNSEPEAAANDAQAPAPRDPFTPRQVAPDAPAINSPLPQAEVLPGIGPGPAVSGGLPDPKEIVKPSKNGTGNGGGAAGGIPGTAFMGIKDKATRVVYVIDASGSMLHHNAMGKAKGALVASLNALDPGQQFQVIFYSESPRVMPLKSTPKKQLFFATDLNKTAAQQFVQQIQPDAGTEHLSAIQLGLSFSPEVLYLLTDSGDPGLLPSELNDIQKRNHGRTRIHCIEFGVGRELSRESSNFLKKLAQQNDGTHRYVDVVEGARK